MPIRTLAWAALLVTAALPLRAQDPAVPTWNDPRALALVDQAIARRAAQLADTGLTDYRAVAHGYLTFLAQLGEGFPDPAKVVRADELAVEVYWRAPNRSKQRIIGRRDTLLLPTDIAYHRDHLAIVQNNFPAIIRVGDGDEVRDVPHPLSAAGRGEYDYALGDSLSIRSGTSAWEVQMVRVRPKDDRRPAAVGAVFLDRETAAVVRMTVSFTRAALLDPQLEDVSIVLDNGLVDGRFWLPRRQEVEIRRTGEWMDFPARGIIRGRWEICCVEVNRGVPAEFFAGPEIVFAPLAEQRAYKFPGRIVDSLPPESRVAESADTRQVQEEARTLVRAEALRRTRRASAGTSRVSDLVRVNRVEGLALGSGATLRLGAGLAATARGRYGFADHELKHRVSLGWTAGSGANVSLFAHNDFRGAGEEPEVSGVRNSIAAQEFGVDLFDDYRVRGAGLSIEWGNPARARWRLGVEQGREAPLAVHARPPYGSYQPAFGAERLTATRVLAGVTTGNVEWPLGTTARLDLNASSANVRRDSGAARGVVNYGRAALLLDLERTLGSTRVVLHTAAAGVTGDAPPAQALVRFGGPTTGPGYALHSLGGTVGVSQRVEWQFRLGAFRLPLGRFGTTSVPVTLVTFAHGVWTSSPATADSLLPGLHASAGLGVLTILDLVRLDVAKGLHGGRWVFSADFGRFLWRVL